MGERTAIVQIITRNAVQDATQANVFCCLGSNLPANPSIEDLNRLVMSSEPISETEPARTEPLFGTHIREAVAIVRDWVKNP